MRERGRKLDYTLFGRMSIKTTKLKGIIGRNHFIISNAAFLAEHKRDTFSRLEFSPSLDEVDVLLLDLADTSTPEENGFVLYHDDPDNISR